MSSDAQAETDKLRATMTIPEEPYLEGISAIIRTRDEERHIADCIRSIQSWIDEIVVSDMESGDRTFEIASELGAKIIHHPKLPNFDRARNVSSLKADFSHVLYLDPDDCAPSVVDPQVGDANNAQQLLG